MLLDTIKIVFHHSTGLEITKIKKFPSLSVYINALTIKKKLIKTNRLECIDISIMLIIFLSI